MLKWFYPYKYIDNVFIIDYSKLYQMGYRGIIFDVDNTLVHHGEDSTPEVEELFHRIHGIGFKTVLLSDNSSKRLNKFAQNLDTPYICDAQKPKIEGYLEAIKMLGIKKTEIIFIGDQIFRDIFGANRCGIDNILVKYMRYDNETKIGIRRHIENMLLRIYNLSKYRNRIGDIIVV